MTAASIAAWAAAVPCNGVERTWSNAVEAAASFGPAVGSNVDMADLALALAPLFVVPVHRGAGRLVRARHRLPRQLEPLLAISLSEKVVHERASWQQLHAAQGPAQDRSQRLQQ